MSTLIHSILPFLGIIVFLVVVHELGHFLTAKAFGVKVLEFGVGYPPRIWGKRVGETDYTLNLLPLGGFVRLLGEEDPTDPRSLAAKSRPVRILVLVAGAAMNAVLPVLLFTITFLIPQDVAVGRVSIDKVSPESPAARAGVKTGDVLLTVNGHKIENVGDASYYINLARGRTMTWDLRRPLLGGGGGVSAGSENVSVDVYGRWAPPSGQGPTGISLAQAGVQRETRSYPLWEAVPKAVVRTAESLVLYRNQIFSWIAARAAPQVQGPVGIAQVTGEVVKQAGWTALFELAAQLSISLAIFNLLPVPMLDGGRVLFVLIEMLRGGKRVPPEKEALVHLAGFVLLLSMVAVISFFDIQRIINGDSPFR